MPTILYKSKKFSSGSRGVIVQANAILHEYEQQGYDLTLRQLYYQFVSRGRIGNHDREYKRLGSIVNDARLAGLIDWEHIVDRTRNLRSVAHWNQPNDVIDAAAASFRVEKWATQENQVEVWIEKDALIGVIERVCRRLDVPYFSCRGYTSQSEMWSAAQRLGEKVRAGKHVRILHLGDHDPSGIDMSRDIEDRVTRFIAQDSYNAELVDGDEAYAWTRARFGLDRLALNMDQIEQYDPPPNPAKLTDSRGRSYVEEHGNESWELDALEPTVIGHLIENAVIDLRDEDAWDEAREQEDRHREALTHAARRWSEVVTYLDETPGPDDQ